MKNASSFAAAIASSVAASAQIKTSTVAFSEEPAPGLTVDYSRANYFAQTPVKNNSGQFAFPAPAGEFTGFWVGDGFILLNSDKVGGPWSPADSQVNSQDIPTAGDRKFFQLSDE